MKAMEKLDILEGNLVLEVGKSGVERLWKSKRFGKPGRLGRSEDEDLKKKI